MPGNEEQNIPTSMIRHRKGSPQVYESQPTEDRDGTARGAYFDHPLEGPAGEASMAMMDESTVLDASILSTPQLGRIVSNAPLGTLSKTGPKNENIRVFLRMRPFN